MALVVAALVGFPVAPGSAATDGAAPTVEALTITPASVSTAGGPALVTATVRLTDDLAGLSIGGSVPLSEITFRGPGGQQIARGWFSQANRLSGSPLDGTYGTVVSIPQYAETGQWSASITTVDQAANSRQYTAAQLAGAGFASGFTQTALGDTNAPTVASFAISPATVDTALQAQTVTFSLRIADDASGVSAGTTTPASQVVVRGPTGSHTLSATFGAAQRVSGGSLDGFYAASASLPQWSEQGIWTVSSLVVRDNVGNSRTLSPADLVGATFQTSFTQAGAGDIVAPRFRAFTITPSAVDTSTGAASIVLRARLTDSGSGVATGVGDTASEVLFRSPSGEQLVIAQFGSQQRTTGNQYDGWYEYAATLPPGAEQGTWTLVYARPVDAAHNAATANASEWSGSGFPVSFEVRSDGTPSAPRNVNAVKTGTTGATVSWLPPSVIGSSSIVGYTATATPGGDQVVVGAGANTATFNGLATGITYTFQVQAQNAAGLGAISPPSNEVTIGDVPDLVAPTLTALSLSPVVVEATSGPATITIDLGVNDDASGPTGAAGQRSAIVFTAPSGGATAIASFGPDQLLAGTPASGSYRTQLTIPQGSEQGAWTISALTLRDVAGHVRTVTTDELVAASRPTVVVVRAATVPGPPLAVSAAAGAQSATVSWLPPANDGNAAVSGYVITSSPGNKTAIVGAGILTASVTGLTNGTAYSFTVKAVNAVGTGPASAPSNAVTPGGADLVVPTLASFSITPRQLAGGPAAQTVTITARITDAGSGVADVSPWSTVTFARPDGSAAGTLDLGPARRITGTVFDGTYRADLAVPANPPAGAWPVTAVVLRDRSGNQVTIAPGQLAAAGFDSDFTVTADAVPGAPTNASAAAGNASASVSWLPPSDSGSSALTGYTVTSVPGGVTVAVAGTTTSAVVGGLTNGVAYAFVVTASNAAGTGPPSAPSNIVTPGGPDVAAPVLLALAADPVLLETDTGPKTVTVAARLTDAGSGVAASGTVTRLIVRSPSGGESTVAFGAAQRVAGTAADGEYAAAIALPQSSPQGTTTFAGVVLRDAAGNQAVMSEAQLAGAGFSTGFTVTGARVPGAVTNVECRWTEAGMIVSWAPPSDPGSSAVTTYTVTAAPGGTVQTGATTHVTMTMLANGRAYSFTVRATNGTGTGLASSPSSLCTPGLDTGGAGTTTRPTDRPVGGLLDDAKDRIPTR